MANQLYNLSSGLGGAGISPYSSRYVVASGADTYKFEPSTRFISSAADALRYASVDGSSSAIRLGQGGEGLSLRGGEASRDVALGVAQGAYSQLSLSGVEDFCASSVTESIIAAGLKRQSEALYHLGTHNTMGQSEALFSTNHLVKRPRTETASHLPIYPQRPGEKDCTYYMLTRTCKFGDACKFDHPIWVPEGGIPDWKEVPLVPTAESLPERPGEPDCPYYMKTYKCKFGVNCKFNHPKADTTDVSVLPERPSEPICSYYSKTGKCKFGANCIFNHPKDLQIQIPSNGQDCGITEPNESTVIDGIASTNAPVTPALLHNSKGLPIRPGEQDCPFYLKTGSCKYGARCRFNHPDRNAINPPVAGGVVPAVCQTPNIINSSLSLLPNIDPRLIQTNLMVDSVTYPQRPGEPECDFYMKTGLCKFSERCKFHHPIDRSAPITLATKQIQQPVKLTLAGFPRREGSIICPFYLKTGTCKYGATCRYDHPPPGEVMSMSTNQSAVTAVDAGNSGNVTKDDDVKQES